MVFEYIGLPYEQKKYGVNDLQSRDAWFKEDKPKLIEKNPAINLPYLIDG